MQEASQDLRQVLRANSGKVLSLWDEEDRQIELARGGHGSPDYLPLGVGQLKLSGRTRGDGEHSGLMWRPQRAPLPEVERAALAPMWWDADGF